MRILILAVFLLNSKMVFGADWSKTSLSVLQGNNFELSSKKKRTEYTFDHASGFKYGDNFFWFEVTDGNSPKNSNLMQMYGEYSPRISFGKIFGFIDKNRFVQDVLFSNTFEYGRSAVITRNRLHGVGFDLNIPGFKFFQINFYRRTNPDIDDSTFQTTIAYQANWEASKKWAFIWGAYIDIVHGDIGSRAAGNLVESHWHSAQQFLFDLGRLWQAPEFLQAGFEYQYWHRKYGTPGGPIENNLKVMVKYLF